MIGIVLQCQWKLSSCHPWYPECCSSQNYPWIEQSLISSNALWVVTWFAWVTDCSTRSPPCSTLNPARWIYIWFSTFQQSGVVVSYILQLPQYWTEQALKNCNLEFWRNSRLSPLYPQIQHGSKTPWKSKLRVAWLLRHWLCIYVYMRTTHPPQYICDF